MLSSEAEVDSSCSKRPLLLCAWAGFQHSTGALILARNLEPACVLCFFFSLSPGWSSALPKGLLQRNEHAVMLGRKGPWWQQQVLNALGIRALSPATNTFHHFKGALVRQTLGLGLRGRCFNPRSFIG